MNAAVTTMPNTASRVDEVDRSPRATRVASSFTTMPAFCSPMKAMNRPMPALTASFSGIGIELMIASRTPVTASSRNTSPDTNVAASAVSHGTPSPITTENAKKAFSPMPGAWAMGSFAHRPMIPVPSAAARHVATNTAPKSMPASGRMPGLTTTM